MVEILSPFNDDSTISHDNIRLIKNLLKGASAATLTDIFVILTAWYGIFRKKEGRRVVGKS